MTATTYTEVAKVPCRACCRDVAVVRAETQRGRKRVSILRVSRHLLPEIGDGDGFCLGSLVETELAARPAPEPAARKKRPRTPRA